MTPPAHIDDAIDRAARDLAAYEAPLALHARVLAEIADSAPPARPWWPWLGLASAAASLAVAVVALRMMTAAGDMPAVARVTLATTAPAAAAPVSPAAIRLPVRVAASSIFEVTDAEMSDAERAWRDRSIPALVVPEPLQVAVSQPDTVAIPLLNVPAITVSPVIVAPIDTARWSRDR